MIDCFIMIIYYIGFNLHIIFFPFSKFPNLNLIIMTLILKYFLKLFVCQIFKYNENR